MASNWMPKGKGKDQAKENSKPAPKKNEFPIILAGGKGKLHLDKRLMQQINLLHDYAGNVEWSGPVFYNVKKGSIEKPEDIEIVAHAMYPMDIGTSGYTEYEFDAEQTMDMHDYYPEILEKEWDMGHMHTHHNMKAYFSGTDEQELRDNTPNHAYYLSLIVNHAKQYVARLCVMGKRTVKGQSSVSYKGINSKDATNIADIGYEQEVVYAIDLDVTFDDAYIPFMTEVIKIKKRKDEKKKSKIDLHKEASNLRLSNFNQRDREMESWNSSFNINQMSMVDVPDFDPNEDAARDFCYKILECDASARGHWRSLLVRMEQKWVEAQVSGEGDVMQDIFADQIGDCLMDVYTEVFGNTDYWYDNMGGVIEFLSQYQSEFTIVDWLMSELMMYEMPEEEEEITPLGV